MGAGFGLRPFKVLTAGGVSGGGGGAGAAASRANAFVARGGKGVTRQDKFNENQYKNY